MDDPRLDGDLHQAALRGLSRLNYLRAVPGPSGRRWRHWPGNSAASNYECSMWPAEREMYRCVCRAGQRRAGLHLEIHGVDVSPRAIEFAARRAAGQQAAVHFSILDVLAGPLPEGFDVVTCSLFLHHLAEEQGVLLLQAMAKATKHLVLVNDLHRQAARTSTGPFGCMGPERIRRRSRRRCAVGCAPHVHGT